MTLEHDEGLEREHEAFAEWDAAYLLGALAPAERRAYEDHLAGCERCRAAVAELAPLPGLLARAPRPDMDDEAHDESGSPDETASPDETGVPDEPTWPDEPAAEAVMAPAGATPDGFDGPAAGASHRVARETRHRLRRRVLMGIAAVLVVGLAVAVPLVGTHGEQPAQTVALAAQTTTPLTASVSLTPASWGTRLSMECSYPASSATSVPGYGPSGSASGVYSLVITDVNGVTSQVSTWSAQPGVDVQLDAATAVPLDRIASVTIQNSAGAPVLSADLTSS